MLSAVRDLGLVDDAESTQIVRPEEVEVCLIIIVAECLSLSISFHCPSPKKKHFTKLKRQWQAGGRGGGLRA